jgi:hypothetical protein
MKCRDLSPSLAGVSSYSRYKSFDSQRNRVGILMGCGTSSILTGASSRVAPPNPKENMSENP